MVNDLGTIVSKVLVPKDMSRGKILKKVLAMLEQNKLNPKLLNDFIFNLHFILQ